MLKPTENEIWRVLNDDAPYDVSQRVAEWFSSEEGGLWLSVNSSKIFRLVEEGVLKVDEDVPSDTMLDYIHAEIDRRVRKRRRLTAVWRVAAREVGRTRGDTYFHSLNEGCIEAGRGVTAFGTFRFAAGSLEMPRLTSARLEGWTVTLEWETGEDRPKAGWTDRVFVGYFHETLPRTPGMVTAAEARRADGRTTVTIPDLGQAEGGRLHLYLFFGNETLERFSPSVHAEV